MASKLYKHRRKAARCGAMPGSSCVRIIGAVGLGLIVFVRVSLLTPWIAPYGYEEQDLMLGATPPSADTGWALISLAAIC